MSNDKRCINNRQDNFRQFEELTCEIFKKSGYKVSRGERLSETKYCDFTAEIDNDKFFVETKYLVGNRDAIPESILRQMKQLVAHTKGSGKVVLIIAGVINETIKKQCYEEDDLAIVDLSNLLWVTLEHEKERNKLLSITPYSVDEIEYKEPVISLGWIEHSDESKTLIKRLHACAPGKAGAREYEKICEDIVEKLFADDISLRESQKKSNKGLYQIDLVCRIKLGNRNPFWYIVEHGFKSYYVVFEFKNYTEKISQKEIYTTEKYLYAKSLRNVAIMLTTHGADENAKWAVKGCLRENGKLIIVLDTNDLETMLKMKLIGEDPSDHLLSILDTILEELEK